jgi:hypothetical protein
MSENNDIIRYSDDEVRKINEGLQRRNPFLASLNEKIIYDKNFLLEVSTAGYNPLDAEDVQNFLEQKPAKNQERNIILSGADKFKYLGQGEYEEDDLKKFTKSTNTPISMKSAENVYASEFKGKQRELLMENAPEINTDVSHVKLEDEDAGPSYKSLDEAENLLRKNMAKAFGSDDIQINRKEVINENSNQIVRQNDNVEKTLELIKELRALGFSPEEIKQEIQIRFR